MSENDAKAADQTRDQAVSIPDVVPVLALTDTVLFPYVMVPLSVAREASVAAVDHALSENRLVLLVAQRQAETETPSAEDLYTVGTVAGIMRMIKLPDDRIRILVQGVARARVEYMVQEEPFLKAKISRIEEPPTDHDDLEIEAFLRNLRTSLERVAELGKNISPEVMLISSSLEDGARCAS